MSRSVSVAEMGRAGRLGELSASQCHGCLQTGRRSQYTTKLSPHTDLAEVRPGLHIFERRLDFVEPELAIDDPTGRQLYYDVNALSNFVADPVRIVGFNPYSRLADFLIAEAVKHESHRLDRAASPELAKVSA